MKKTPLVMLVLAFAMLVASCASTGEEETTTAAPEETTTTAADTGTEETPTTAAEETTTTAADPKADWPEKILYGFIPSEKQEKLGDTVQPYMDYLTAELGIEFEGVITADYNGLVVAMGAGNADLGAFGPFGYIQAQEQYPEIEVLIQSIRYGSDLYHGQWFTNDASICTDEPVVGAYEWIDGTPTIVDPTEAKALQVGWAYVDGELTQEVLEDGTEVAKGLVCTAPLEAVVGKTVAFTSATSTSGGVFP
ncbi:MAG: PhnD/SsuA/transferrin family substrate-binding protein, partial [Actinomycetota bacterium]